MDKQILVVDDSDEIRECYRMVLEDAGYRVVTAASGEEGFERVRERRPDLVLLDMVMPGMDGLEMLLKLHSDLAPPVPPTILVSGFDLSEEEARRSGALGFVRKPVDGPHLLAMVQQALSGAPLLCATTAAGRARSDEARRRARDAAAALVKRIEAHGQISRGEVNARLTAWLGVVVRYFGLQGGFIGFMRGDHLRVAQVVGSDVQVGDDLGARLPQCNDVLETRASLVLADAASRPPFGDARMNTAGIRFFAGVPVFGGDRLAVGVICLFDGKPRAFAAEDLAILELFGRETAQFLSGLAAGRPPAALPGRNGAGMMHGSALEVVLDAEVRLLRRVGGSMTLAIVEAADLWAVCEAFAASPSPLRLGAGVIAPARVALYKRETGDDSAAAIEALLAAVEARTHVSAVGLVSVGGAGLPALDGRDLLHLANLALDRALASDGGIDRLVLRHELQPL